MIIPFRSSSVSLLLVTLLAACGGGGGGQGSTVDVVVAGGAHEAVAAPIQAAPVSTGVLTQPPAVALPAAAADTVVVAPVAIDVSASLPSDVVVPAVDMPTVIAAPVMPVSPVLPSVPAIVAPAGTTPADPITVVAPVTDATTLPVAPFVPVTPVTPVTPPTPVGPTTTSTLTWVVCASEGYVCSFSGSQIVRYGTSTAYVDRVATEQTPCDNATFGDPASWQPKQCSVLVSVVTSSAPRAQAPLGVYLGAEAGGVAKVDGYAAWLGRRPQRALEFLSNNDWQVIEDAASRDAWLWTPTGLGMTFSVPMLPGDHSSTMAAGARGDYDAHFRTIAANFVRDGQPNAIVRIGWEFNYGWYPWAAGANVQDFVTYWRRIVTAMRSVPGQNFRFDWCPAIGQGDLDIAKAYPGDAYVDIIGLDVYNQTWANPVPTSDALWETLLTQPFGLQWHRNFGLTHGKPISFPEWGTGTRPDGHGMGDDATFIRHMAAWIADNDVAYHDYWDYQASDYDAKLSNGSFPMAGAAFKAAFGR